MAIEYTFTSEGDTLFVHAAGFDESLAQVQAYGLAIIQACAAGGHTRVLCDERELDYRLGTLDTYAAAEFIASQVPYLARVAIVCPAQSLDEAAFWEDVAVNRGLAVRLFTDRDAAVQWLK